MRLSELILSVSMIGAWKNEVPLFEELIGSVFIQYDDLNFSVEKTHRLTEVRLY